MSYYPLALEAPRKGSELDMSVKIETATGWLDLADGALFDLEATTFDSQSVTWRKQEATSPWVEGSFVTSAVREDVTENLSVYVYGESRSEHMRMRKALTDALGQLTYRILVRVEETAVYWDCEPADYSITTSREFLHATMCVVKAQIPRKPELETLLAASEEL